MTTTFLIPAFDGPVLGGITSMVGAVAGGLILGRDRGGGQPDHHQLQPRHPGPPQAATIIVLLLVLVFRPSGLFGKEA